MPKHMPVYVAKFLDDSLVNFETFGIAEMLDSGIFKFVVYTLNYIYVVYDWCHVLCICDKYSIIRTHY